MCTQCHINVRTDDECPLRFRFFSDVSHIDCLAVQYANKDGDLTSWGECANRDSIHLAPLRCNGESGTGPGFNAIL